MEKLTLQLSLNEVNAIIAGLAKLPYESVFQLVDNIQKQAQEQLRVSKETEVTNQ
jgi:hypothetical protein